MEDVDDNGVEGITGALLDGLPDDRDNLEEEDAARDAWEVRELERLLQDWDAERERQAVARDRARRRTLTDAECLREDGDGRRKNETEETTRSNQSKTYHHRGAFYMDESEWGGAEDVRHKADEYARAATTGGSSKK